MPKVNRWAKKKSMGAIVTDRRLLASASELAVSLPATAVQPLALWVVNTKPHTLLFLSEVPPVSFLNKPNKFGEEWFWKKHY